MQAKKALAVLLALSMTTAPQAVVSASAENATVQENSDVAPEKENSEDAGEESGSDANEEPDEATTEETEQNADTDPVNEEFLQITEKRAFQEGESVLIEIVSANTAYNRLYIGNRSDEDKTPVIEGSMDEEGRYHYLFYIDPQYLGEKAGYVPGNTADNSWYTEEDLYFMLPSEAEPAQETVDDNNSENMQEPQETEENIPADNSGEGTISKSGADEMSDSLWKIGSLEGNTAEETQDTDEDSYRIESLEEDSVWCIEQ